MRDSPLQFSLRTLMAVVTLISLALSFGCWLGGHGAVLVLDGIIITIYLANLRKQTSLFGITVPRMTRGEFIAWAAICLVLHGLCLPAVTT